MHSRSITRLRNVGQEEKRTIRCLFERVYSNGELSLVDEITAPNFVGHSTEAPREYHGVGGLKTHVVRLRRALFGFTIELHEIDRHETTWEVAWTARGTHERPLLGVEPTCIIGQAGEEPHGKRITIPGVSEITVANGLIHQQRMRYDMNRLRRELGRPSGTFGMDTAP